MKLTCSTLLLSPDAADSAAAAAAPLNPATAATTITSLQSALADADTAAKALLDDPHFAKCPFVAAIRSGINNGAVSRLTHLAAWLKINPVPAPAPAALSSQSLAPRASRLTICPSASLTSITRAGTMLPSRWVMTPSAGE